MTYLIKYVVPRLPHGALPHPTSSNEETGYSKAIHHLFHNHHDDLVEST